MSDARQVARRCLGGFTLVELLTVIGLIIAVAALAVPNFAAMIQEQRLTAAVNALQVAIMRARTYAVNDELDHSVEFCSDENSSYIRIEAESAYLENIPSLDKYLQVTKALRAIPRAWYYAFISHRDAWGPDGIRLLSGVFDCYWSTQTSDPGWGHLDADWTEPAWKNTYQLSHLFYDNRYQYPDKGALTRPWRNTSVSVGEYTNNAGDHGYQDVNDYYHYTYISAEFVAVIRDNLAVDDFIYLPYDVKVVLPGPGVSGPVSTLVNFDAAKNVSGMDVCPHGWDGTLDLRFGKTAYLLQAESPEIVLKRGEDQFVRLKLIRGTARLKRMQ